ncbi:MAG: hypothetical protein JSU94_01305 [Phycisphaerales bacterium]|nr:MAG: hypothetical protein JSU94_01305 [Phycisphaerales bacterium]
MIAMLRDMLKPRGSVRREAGVKDFFRAFAGAGSLPAVLLTAALLPALAISVKVAGFVGSSARSEGLTRRVIEASRRDTHALEESMAKSQALADALRRDSLFSPAASKQNPVREVLAIFGDQAWVNDAWRKAGDTIGEAKIISIEPTLVRVQWDGRVEVFAPVGLDAPEGSTGAGGSPHRAGPDGKRAAGNRRAAMVALGAGRKRIAGGKTLRGQRTNPPERPAGRSGSAKGGDRLDKLLKNGLDKARARQKKELLAKEKSASETKDNRKYAKKSSAVADKVSRRSPKNSEKAKAGAVRK